MGRRALNFKEPIRHMDDVPFDEWRTFGSTFVGH